jgi:hypothetical protein
LRGFVSLVSENVGDAERAVADGKRSPSAITSGVADGLGSRRSAR